MGFEVDLLALEDVVLEMRNATFSTPLTEEKARQNVQRKYGWNQFCSGELAELDGDETALLVPGESEPVSVKVTRAQQ